MWIIWSLLPKVPSQLLHIASWKFGGYVQPKWHCLEHICKKRLELWVNWDMRNRHSRDWECLFVYLSSALLSITCLTAFAVVLRNFLHGINLFRYDMSSTILFLDVPFLSTRSKQDWKIFLPVGIIAFISSISFTYSFRRGVETWPLQSVRGGFSGNQPKETIRNTQLCFYAFQNPCSLPPPQSPTFVSLQWEESAIPPLCW